MSLSASSSPGTMLICDSQDLTLHTMLSDGVATVRQNHLQGVMSAIAL